MNEPKSLERQESGEGVALLIPCLDEAATIGQVVRSFRAMLPAAEIYVFDNGSSDDTAEQARAAGARVAHEPRRGKGHVVAAMLASIDADLYLLVDGDDTYDPAKAPELLAPLRDGRADMTVAARLERSEAEAFRPLHRLGNRLVARLVNGTFGCRLSDIMSGYRAFNRRLARSVPLLSGGFEIETEMTLRALDQGFRIVELPAAYRARPEGSQSKLRTFRDGSRVIAQLVSIVRAYRPLAFFGAIGIAFGLLGALFGAVVVQDFLQDRYVDRVPTAILATGCVLVGATSLSIGVVLDALDHRLRELVWMLRRQGNDD